MPFIGLTARTTGCTFSILKQFSCYIALAISFTAVFDGTLSVLGCTTLQRCQNCYITSSCDVQSSDIPESDCMALLTLNNIVIYNPAYITQSWDPCHYSTCSGQFKMSSYGSAAYRLVNCYNGCNNVTITRVDNTAVSSSVTPDITESKSETDCIAYCLEISYNGTNTECTHESSTCKIYTSCPTGGCATQPNSNVDMFKLICDYTLTTCSVPASPGNGTVTHTGVAVGDTASYDCNSGYTIDNSGTRTCGSDGNWNGTQPSCTPVNCSTPWPLINGTVSVSDTTYLNSATYQCNTGYTLSGSNVSFCDSTGNWNGSQPQCDLVSCGTLTSLVNGTFNVTSIHYHGTTNYSCDYGYELSGPSTRTCQANATWDGTDPTCVPVNCGGPDNVTNAVVTYTSTDRDSVAVYQCDPACNITGTNQTTCLPSGSWSLPAPSCNCPQCPALNDPINGVVTTTNGETMGSIAIYSCNSGYSRSGPKQRTCLSSGTWTATEPNCKYTPPVYIMACLCNNYPQFTDMTEEEIIDQLIHETSIDTDATAAAEQKFICMEDNRTSSTLIGTTGVIIMTVIFGLLVFLDCLTLLGERCDRKILPTPKLTPLEHYLTS